MLPPRSLAACAAACTLALAPTAQEEKALFDAAVVRLSHSAAPYTHLFDFNGDEHVDAVGFRTNLGTSYSAQVLSVYVNDGLGRLSPHWLTSFNDFATKTSTYSPSTLAVGDLRQGDGYDDFVFGYAKELRVYLSDGFAFAAEPTETLPEKPRSIQVADFDGDGRTDYAVLMSTLLRVYLQDDAQTAQVLEVTVPFIHWKSLRTGELDGDGVPDLLAVAQDLSLIHISEPTRPY